jgi:hypothetical protein
MELKKKYFYAKREAQEFMQSGNVAGYLQALLKMNNYRQALRRELAV